MIPDLHFIHNDQQDMRLPFNRLVSIVMSCLWYIECIYSSVRYWHCEALMAMRNCALTHQFQRESQEILDQRVGESFQNNQRVNEWERGRDIDWGGLSKRLIAKKFSLVCGCTCQLWSHFFAISSLFFILMYCTLV